VQAGDLIVRLNETPVKGLSMWDAVEMMRGEKGTNITLTIIRQGENKPLKITVTRDIISNKSIRSEVLEDGFGYVRISQFQSNSADDFIQAVQTLKKNNKGKLNGLVIDLRNNAGGVLETCVQIADALLDREKLKYDGIIVYTKGRMSGSQLKEKAHGGDMLNGAPIVVLVNGGSASAAEIVAGALQDHKRALIVGTQTFGKGSVQTVLPLKDNRGIKLTTALYYTPAGRSIQANGIKPDIIVPFIKIPSQDIESSNNSAFSLREENLKNHLENANSEAKKQSPATGTTSAKEKDKNKDKENKDLPLIVRDYQLYEALNVLKGLTLTKQ
jgi:carboxyl-terminal processing protease